MSDYGIRVAKSGFDAFTDSDANMAFTSARYSDSILAVGSVIIQMNGTTQQTYTLAHGLGYAPQVRAFWINISGSGEALQIPHYVALSSTPTSPIIYCDATNIYVRVTTDSVSSDVHTFLVYIFEKSI